MPTPLLDRIEAKKREKLVPQIPSTGVVSRTEVNWGDVQTRMTRMSPFVRRLHEKRLTPKALYNGAWTEPDQGGAA